MVSTKVLCKQTACRLAQGNIEEATYEAKLLVGSIGSFTSAKMMMDPPFPAKKLPLLEALIQKRLTGIPLQYLLGEWEFYGLSFKVGEGVLIPRQDTEVLVDKALAYLQHIPAPTLLDLCSGSGCIPIALTQNLNACKAYAVEYSENAYSYLTANIKAHGGSVTPMLSDALSLQTLARFADESLDCITSNPPYLNEQDMEHLQKEVRFEPEDALYAPENGYLFYRLLPKLWRPKLKKGGLLAFEVGIGQARTVMGFLAENGYRNIGTENDLAGIARVVYGYRS